MDKSIIEALKKKSDEVASKIKDMNSSDSFSSIRAEISELLYQIKKASESEKDCLREVSDKLHLNLVESLKKDLINMQNEAKEKITNCINEKELHDTKVSFLGKKGKLTAILRSMKDLKNDERPIIGAIANEVRELVEKLEETKSQNLKEIRLRKRIEKETVDISLPARHHKKGHIHPLNKAMRLIMDTFIRMGYSVEEGPEIEKDYYNFYCLNLPKDHPARDMQDSFYITPDILLRTHTSPVQARTLQRHEPNSPIRMIAPGKVFRWDNDATHSPVFHQIEGLVVDKGVSFSDLKGTLEIFLKNLFGADTKIRFRASYFPFTEPSAEVDISFSSRTNSDTGEPEWLEILGCGMVHPNVLKLNNYDPEKVSGFAFGMGIERIAMLLYGIDDLRLFYENDMRFLKQF